MLKWIDNRDGELVRFENLEVGTPFEHGDCLYIKTCDGGAFDVINSVPASFNPAVQVVEREATITFH